MVCRFFVIEKIKYAATSREKFRRFWRGFYSAFDIRLCPRRRPANRFLEEVAAWLWSSETLFYCWQPVFRGEVELKEHRQERDRKKVKFIRHFRIYPGCPLVEGARVLW